MATVKQGSEEWFIIRSNCAATCSRFAAAIGVCSYCSRAKYWRLKTKRQQPEETNDAMQFGIDNEDRVRQWYLNMMLQQTDELPYCEEYGFKHLPNDCRFGGSPDGLCIDGDGNTYVLEIKCTYPSYERDSVPIGHLLQLVGLMKVFNAAYAHYVSWAPGISYFVSKVTFDDMLWTDFIYPELCVFAGYVANDKQPPRVSSARKRTLIEAIEKYTHCEPLF